MRKIDKAVILFGLLLTFLVAALNSCTYNYTYPEREKIVYVEKIVPDKKLEKKVKNLKKALRFQKYKTDSLQCKYDSLAYSVIKKEEQDGRDYNF